MNLFLQKDFLESDDWDVLIILDACRMDIFSMFLIETNLKGILYCVNSQSRNTEDWYKIHWNEEHKDTILISANPHSKVTGTEKNFFMSIGIYLLDKLHGVETDWKRPEPALDVLIDLQKEHDKKFVVHLIPPHLPYIGEKGKQFIKELEVKGNNTMSIYRAVENYGRQYGFKRPYDCYVESMLEALNVIEKYLPEIKGKIVITSDHGELIGEGNKYDHNYPLREIFYVPWFENVHV